MHVDASNDSTARGWNGSTGDFWTDNADLFDAGVGRYLAPLLAAAAVEPGEGVLDVGCGAGRTTIEAARRGADATGVDLSERLLDLARSRADREGVPGARFVQADAQVADLGVHDVLLSRTGVMFFGDPLAAFTNLAGALRPGGRVALAVWAAYREQEWIRSFRTAAAGREVPPPPPGAPHPFSLGDPDHVRGLLGRAGFVDVGVEGVREPMYFGPDVATAERMALGIVGGMLDELDDTARARALDALRDTLEDHRGPDGVTYPSAMWIVTARGPG